MNINIQIQINKTKTFKLNKKNIFLCFRISRHFEQSIKELIF